MISVVYIMPWQKSPLVIVFIRRFLQHVERAEEVKRELDDVGFVFMPDMLRNLWHLAAFYKKDLTESLSYKEKL